LKIAKDQRLIDRYLADRIERNVSDPSSRAHAIAINEGLDDLDPEAPG
jgi:hypothetical protein